MKSDAWGGPDRLQWPAASHVYENHHLDSPRWQRFETRPDDIVVTTAYKSGTTWTQTIVAHLIFEDGEFPGPVMDIFPWVDMRAIPFEVVEQITRGQRHRRCLKTHLARDGLTLEEHVKYIYVGRDLRDVFMSLWNHYTSYSEGAFEALNGERLLGNPLPRCPGDIHEFWKEWVNRSWFEWEQDGYPFWSSSHHAQTWWDYRHLPNLLFVHFGDLLDRPRSEIERIASFLGIEASPEKLDRVTEEVAFEKMKRDSHKVMGAAQGFFDGGAKKFLHKGTNGRWREALRDDELAQYRAMVERTLSPDCARWLEEGRKALSEAAHP